MNMYARTLLKYKLAFIVFLCGIFLSATFGYQIHQNNQSRVNHATSESLDNTVKTIFTRIELYQYGLRGARGAVLTVGENNISRALFYRYSLTRDIDIEFPGARGFGFIRRIKPDHTEQFVASASADGWPDFKIREMNSNPGERYVIQYIEPVERNIAAVGLDIASETNRFNAAYSAMLSGEVRLTAPITLVQATGQPQQSFLILLPLYQGGAKPENQTDREQLAIGWSYAPLSMTDVLAGINLDASKFVLQLDDVTEDKAGIRFFSNASDVNQGLYPIVTTQSIYGRTWRFTYAATPFFIQGMQLLSPVKIVLSGAFVSLLFAVLTGLMLLNQSNRRRLFEEQGKLAALVESSADGIISCTLDGTVISWNSGAEALFGYRDDEVKSQLIHTLIVPPQLKDETNLFWQRLQLGESTINFETTRLRKDGSTIAVSLTISPIYSLDNKLIGASKTIRDISKQKAVEAKIHELNASLESLVLSRTAELNKLNLLFKHVLSAASEFAIIATDIDGQIQLFNRGAENLLGYSADEVVNQCTPLHFHDIEELSIRAESLREMYQTADLHDFQVLIYQSTIAGVDSQEWQYCCKDHHRIAVNLVVTTMRNENLDIVGYLFIATDITEQKQKHSELLSTQKQLIHKTEQLTLAHEVAELGIWEWRLDDNSLLWNARMFEFYEQPISLHQNGLEYSHWETRVHPDDRAVTAGQLQAAVAGQGKYTPKFRLILPSGTTRYIQGAAYVERNHQGEATRVIGINRDITSEQLLEINLREAKDAADASSAAKSMFLANMSHEIRTPINAVQGMLQLLKATELTRQQDDYTSKAQIAAKSLLNIINDILDYSKIEAGKLEVETYSFNVDEIMSELAILSSPILGNKNVELLFDIDKNMPDYLLGDGHRLQQVLLNLTGNAIKFTANGEIIIRLQKLIDESNISHIRFSVIDTGIGINASQQQRIFDGFTQAEASTSRQYGGSGLGLVISKSMIQLMGGELQLKSEPGKGSCFWFDLPCVVASGPEQTAATQLVIDKCINVLIVDDNEVALEILKKSVEQLGATVFLANSGSSALKHVEDCLTNHQKIDVILMDYRMPGMNGFETAIQIKARHGAGKLPIIVMISAFGREEVVASQKTEFVPYDAFLTKPVTSKQLRQHLSWAITGELGSLLAKIPPKKSKLPLQGLRLLLVEDNEFNRIVASELLQNEGAAVDIAIGGQEGVDAVISGSNTYDLVLMDMQMPRVDGMQATRKIRADIRFDKLPIVAMTANVVAADKENCLLAGMNGHLAKPFDLETVIETILFFTKAGLAKSVSKQKSMDEAIEVQQIKNLHEENNGSRQQCNGDVFPNMPVAVEVKTLESLLKPFAGNETFFRRVLGVFERNQSQQWTSLENMWAQQNLAEVLTVLHTMKGTCGTIGLSTLFRVISEIEEQFKDGVYVVKAVGDSSPVDLVKHLRSIADDELANIHELLESGTVEVIDEYASPKNET